MELSAAMQDAMNQQIQTELESAYLYLSMATFFSPKNLGGSAHWMRVQAQEEVTHAMKFIDHVEDRGARVVLGPLAQPKLEFASALEAFEYAAAHEREVSTKIQSLYDLAAKERDYASQGLLQWFITEQVEEERSASQIVETLRMVGDSAPGLFMVDKELAKRGTEGA
ncbi:MAG: ferritin [Gemmatimonadales bacterium]|nr:ferritin [Gemmatimonadales bacterium]